MTGAFERPVPALLLQRQQLLQISDVEIDILDEFWADEHRR
jgi:hypothetical protein